jgi:hypothetical protein
MAVMGSDKARATMEMPCTDEAMVADLRRVQAKRRARGYEISRLYVSCAASLFRSSEGRAVELLRALGCPCAGS